MLTSSRPGTAAAKSARLARFRSWPALTPTPTAPCGTRRLGEAFEGAGGVYGAVGLGVAFGVKLDAFAAQIGGGGGHGGIGIDEDADPAAKFFQFSNDRLQFGHDLGLVRSKP